ncbi:hypothetical protein [Embleya sp. NPDC059237]|uniref:hypothetical protein n=1 Tax=Embleya sp. NPDC059237 TaxID=3346784 RepID=UPI00368F4BE6
MGDDSGGTRALRMWARDAAARADLLIPFTEVPWTTRFRALSEPGLPDRTIDELSQLEALLPPSETARHAVVARLGALLAMRCVAPDGATTEDRKRALSYLRQVRAAEPEAPVWERRCAAFGLLLVMFPLAELGVLDGRAPELSAFMDWYIKDGRGVDVAELPRLIANVRALPLPPELRQYLDQAMPGLALLEEMSKSGGMPLTDEQLESVLPDDFSIDRSRMLHLFRMATENQPRTTEEGPRAERTDAGRAEEESRHRARMALALDATSPGFIGPDMIRELKEELDRDPVHSPIRPEDRAKDAFSRLQHETLAALRDEDQDVVDAALDRMADAFDRLPEADELGLLMEILRSVCLDSARRFGGNLNDAEHAHRLLEAMRGRFSGAPLPSFLTTTVRFLSVSARLDRAERNEDPTELDTIIDELLTLRECTPMVESFPAVVLVTLAQAYAMRSTWGGDASDRLRGMECLEEAARTGPVSPWARELAAQLQGSIHVLRGQERNDPELIREALSTPPPRVGSKSDWEFRTAERLLSLCDHTKDPAELDEAITKLERLRERVRQGKETHLAHRVLFRLAEAYDRRSDTTRNPDDLDAAIAAALESLHPIAADVLLQAGAEHGLLVAREGNECGILVARLAVAYGRPVEAVAALEWGRALVLQAASTSAGVAEQLRARGHRELADAWLEASPSTSDGNSRNSPAVCAVMPSKRWATGGTASDRSCSTSPPSTTCTTRQRRATSTCWSIWCPEMRTIRGQAWCWHRRSSQWRCWCLHSPGKRADR